MQARIAATMPRVPGLVITGIAWLFAPLWAMDVIAYSWLNRGDRCLIMLTGAAVSSTACLLTVHRESRADARIEQGLAVHRQHEAELALLAGTMMDSGLVKSAPIPQPDQAAGLRLVENG